MAFMRHNNNGRRHNNNRHRHQGNQQQQGQRRHVNRMNHVFESNGPEGRVRGTAQQIVEKYMTMARDAHGAGDKVLSMNYYQHAEHYQRLLNEITEENTAFEREREANRAAHQAQPDINGDENATESAMSDDHGDANGSDQQPQQQRNRPQRAQQNRNAPRRQHNAADTNDDDLNTLPGFLHVPITASAPPPAEQAEPVRSSEQKNDDGITVIKTRAVRAPRARRVTSTAAEEAAE